MSETKTRLPLLRNQGWKTVQVETKKLNNLITHISTSKIMKLNELIYAGVKLVSDKNRYSPKEHEQKLKP